MQLRAKQGLLWVPKQRPTRGKHDSLYMRPSIVLWNVPNPISLHRRSSMPVPWYIANCKRHHLRDAQSRMTCMRRPACGLYVSVLLEITLNAFAMLLPSLANFALHLVHTLKTGELQSFVVIFCSALDCIGLMLWH